MVWRPSPSHVHVRITGLTHSEQHEEIQLVAMLDILRLYFERLHCSTANAIPFAQR